MDNVVRGFPIDCDAKLSSALEHAQKRAKVRTVSMPTIRKHLRELYLNLQNHLYKKDIVGLVVSYDHSASVFPSAYKYTPHSTHVVAKRTSKGWSIIKVHRSKVQRKRVEIFGLETRQAALAKFAIKNILK